MTMQRGKAISEQQFHDSAIIKIKSKSNIVISYNCPSELEDLLVIYRGRIIVRIDNRSLATFITKKQQHASTPSYMDANQAEDLNEMQNEKAADFTFKKMFMTNHETIHDAIAIGMYPHAKNNLF